MARTRIVWQEKGKGLTAVLSDMYTASIRDIGLGVLWTVKKRYDHKPEEFFTLHSGSGATQRQGKAIVQGIWDAICEGEL